ncbi:MAG: molybdopterin-dependent oxidoreductase [Promethearchaeota archaeon]
MDNIIRFGTCTKDCYGSCVFQGFWDDTALEEKLLYTKPLKNHPFTNGFFCPKYKNRQKLLYHPSRIKKPLIRTASKPNNKFETISSQQALDIITKKVMDLIEHQEQSSIIGAYYAGNSGLISMYSPLRFFNKIGATITNAGLCNEGGCEGLSKIFGTYSITNPLQITNSETHLIVVWGSNLSESNNHAYYLVKQAIRNNTKLVVIDSRNTNIAKKSNCFLQPYPGTEHILVKIIIKHLIKLDVYDTDFLKKNVGSYTSIFSKIEKFDDNELLVKIGIEPQDLKNFVDLLVENKHHTLFLIGFGVQKDFYGGRILQTIAFIQILLGNIAKPGSGIIYSQSDFVKPITTPLLEYITQSKKYPPSREIPLISLGKILSEEDFSLIFIYNFNPVSSLPNQNLVREALLDKDLFVVVLDLFLNETTNYADIVIPAKFDLEVSDLVSPYYIPSLSLNVGGPCPYIDCMSNYEFFQQLAWKVGYNETPIFRETQEELFFKGLETLPARIHKDLISTGYHLLFDRSQIPYNDLNFPTRNNKINVRHIKFNFGEDDLKRRLTHKLNEFILISPSHTSFLHSQLGQLNSVYFDDFGKVFLNPKDIKKINFQGNDLVEVYNEYGSADYILAELESLKPGVALIYSGASSPYNTQSNVNLFTPDIPEESGLSGAYNSTKIQIQKRK